MMVNCNQLLLTHNPPIRFAFGVLLLVSSTTSLGNRAGLLGLEGVVMEFGFEAMNRALRGNTTGPEKKGTGQLVPFMNCHKSCGICTKRARELQKAALGSGHDS